MEAKKEGRLMETVTAAVNVLVVVRVAWSLFGDSAKAVWRWLIDRGE
jgi:hypothetical protein